MAASAEDGGGERLGSAAGAGRALACAGAGASTHRTAPPLAWRRSCGSWSGAAWGGPRPTRHRRDAAGAQLRVHGQRRRLGQGRGRRQRRDGAIAGGVRGDSAAGAAFPLFVEANFTAGMEATLDAIASGKGDKVSYLREYYGGLTEQVAAMDKDVPCEDARRIDLPTSRRVAAVVVVVVIVPRRRRWGPPTPPSCSAPWVAQQQQQQRRQRQANERGLIVVVVVVVVVVVGAAPEDESVPGPYGVWAGRPPQAIRGGGACSEGEEEEEDDDTDRTRTRGNRNPCRVTCRRDCRRWSKRRSPRTCATTAGR